MLFPTHCRKVAHKQVDFELILENIQEHLPQHSYYRGSEFLLLQNRDEWACVALEKHSDRPKEEIFHALTGMRVLGLPTNCVYLEDDSVDVLNPTALAAKGVEVLGYYELGGGVRPTTIIIKGEFNHLSFIHEPEMLTINLHDIAPPQPPKLLHLARKVLGYHDVGVPVLLEPRLVDIAGMAGEASTREVILPCYSGEAMPEGKNISFLDSLPDKLPEKGATLVGCKRSLDIYEQHYGKDPDSFHNLCPADDEGLKEEETRPPSRTGLTLAKCCMIGEGHVSKGNVVYVGWGSTLADVEGALRYLVGRAKEAGLAPVNEAG